MANLPWVGVRIASTLAIIVIIGGFVIWKILKEIRSGFPLKDERTMRVSGKAAYYALHIGRILERNNGIARVNWKLLDDWISNEPYLSWVKPKAGSVAFMKQETGLTSKEICLRLIKERSTFLVPGECFEHPDHLRIGYGNNRKLLEDGLEQVSEFLSEI